MFTGNYDSSFCFWLFEKRLTQENCFLFCKKYEKESIILPVSFQLENVPFNIKSCRFECNDCNACSQTIMTHHFAFGYSRKGQQRRIVFSFVKSMVCLTGLFNNQEIFFKYCPEYFPNFHGRRSGGRRGGKILVFHT